MMKFGFSLWKMWKKQGKVTLYAVLPFVQARLQGVTLFENATKVTRK